MRNLPHTLIQIHYHDRPGGVREVMFHYAGAFVKLQPSGKCYIVCSSISGISGPFEFVNIPDCDYAVFSSKRQFENAVRFLQKELSNVFTSASSEGPVAVICHNTNLGKNPALSRALSRTAAQYRNDPRLQFSLVIHDFAEEGRTELLKQLRKTESYGLSIADDLYMTGASVRYIVPSEHNADILKKAGISSTLLPNPVVSDQCAPASEVVNDFKEYLYKRVSGKRFSLNKELPVICNPSRIVPRKNVLESIAIACVVCKSNLLLGKGGPADSSLERCIVSLIDRYKLPVIYDSTKLLAAFAEQKHLKVENPVQWLYSTGSYALSTSLSEGFGYALYEPWLFDKMLVGRKPLGWSPLSGVHCDHLYTSLPVPVEWCAVSSLHKKYYRLWQQMNPGEKKQYDQFSDEFDDQFIRDGLIDFGVLDLQSQIQIVHRVLGSDNEAERWRSLLKKKATGWPGSKNAFLMSNCSCKENRRILREKYDYTAFNKRIMNVFGIQCSSLSFAYPSLKSQFNQVSSLRLLMHRDLSNSGRIHHYFNG